MTYPHLCCVSSFLQKNQFSGNLSDQEQFPSIYSVTNQTDNELMYQVAGGRLDSLGVLYDRYQSQLFGFFTGMTQDKTISADLVQNVFYRLLKYRQQFRGGQFKTWMFHIARNVLHDQYKRKNRIADTDLDTLKEKIADIHRADDNLTKNEDIDQLYKAMALLPEDKREIILLSKYQEKNYKEIGEIIGCTEGNVKVKVFRALNELKALYFQV